MSELASAGLAVIFIFATGAALADVPPWSGPPEFLDRIYGEQIRQHGYDCPRVTRADVTADAAYRDMRWDSQNPLLITCNNDKRFIVAVPPKRPLHSQEPTPPAPAEQIRPL
jgi:hypothetical protein